GVNWTMVRDWNASATYSWTPTAAGSYIIGVWARDANTTADTNAVNLAINYVITSGAAPLSLTGLTPSVASPRTTGTTVTFSAGATGATAPYQYKFLVNDGASTVVAQNWSTASSFAWTPSVAGSYQVSVWVRDANTTADTNAVAL